MMSSLEIFRRIIEYVVAVAAILATAFGCSRAVELGVDVFGVVAVAVAGAFVLGCIVTAAVLLSRRV